MSPLVIGRVGGVYFPAPVKGKSQGFKLSFKVCDIVFGYDRRVNVILYREVFGGKTKRVPAHRIKHVVALKSLLSADNIKRGVRARVTYVQSLSRRVRKLHKPVKLRQRIIVLCGEGLLFVPNILPFFLDFCVIVCL